MNQNRHIIGTGMYDRFVNYLLPNSQNKLKDGEKHPIIYTSNGFEIPSYLGPGTNLVHKIKTGVEPITDTDKTAQAHDIRYHLAKSNEDIRKADLKMVDALNMVQERGSDYKFNIYTGKLPIKAKMKLEDWGLAKPENFTSFGGVKPENRQMMEDKLSALAAEGYGKRRSRNIYDSYLESYKV
jgi:hypothetical protein